MARIIVVVLILFSAAHSCFYVDDSQYFEDINPEYIPDVVITSNFDTIDTVMIVDSLLFRYNIDIDSGKLFYADLYLDDLQVFRSDSVVDSLWFFPNYVNVNETYDITLRAVYKIFTGSLADKIDVEYFIADSTWTVTFLNSWNK